MRTTKVVSITMPPPLYEQAQALAKEENRTMSELIREALRRYQREQTFRKVRGQMESVANQIGVHTEEDVVRLVREVRREICEEEQAQAQLRTRTRA